MGEHTLIAVVRVAMHTLVGMCMFASVCLSSAFFFISPLKPWCLQFYVLDFWSQKFQASKFSPIFISSQFIPADHLAENAEICDY